MSSLGKVIPIQVEGPEFDLQNTSESVGHSGLIEKIPRYSMVSESFYSASSRANERPCLN